VLAAPVDQRLHLVELGVGHVAGPARLGEPGVRRDVLTPAHLAREEPVGQREEREDAHAEVAGGRDHLALRVAFKERPVILRGNERRAPGAERAVRGVGDHPAGEVGVADVADLARRDQVVEGREGLLDRGHRVRGVQLVQVDVVGLEPGERLLHGGPDVAAPALRAGRRAIPHIGALVPPLGGEHHLVAAALERLAERALRTAVLAVGVGGVEQRDALVERRADHRVRLRRVEAATEVVAAEAYHRDEQAGITQGSIAHTPIIRRAAARGRGGTRQRETPARPQRTARH